MYTYGKNAPAKNLILLCRVRDKEIIDKFLTAFGNQKLLAYNAPQNQNRSLRIFFKFIQFFYSTFISINTFYNQNPDFTNENAYKRKFYKMQP